MAEEKKHFLSHHGRDGKNIAWLISWSTNTRNTPISLWKGGESMQILILILSIVLLVTLKQQAGLLANRRHVLQKKNYYS